MDSGLSTCKERTFGARGREFEVPALGVKRGDRRMAWYVYPLGPIGSARYKGPWANIQAYVEDPTDPKDPGSFPYLEVYGSGVEVHLSRPDGSKGVIIGPYSVIQEIRSPHGTEYKVLQRPTDARVAIAWNCGHPRVGEA
jgi:hypothetical protein